MSEPRPEFVFAAPKPPPVFTDDFDDPSEYWQRTTNLPPSSSSSESDLDVDQADWENVSGDLTKRYNRMRQYIDASQQRTKRKVKSPQAAIVPAFNQASRQAPESIKAKVQNVHSSKVEDQLATLGSRFTSNLNLGPIFSVSSLSTRKGGSEVRSVLKDKSDRATSEQVLDPRTRLILFKMIGRGLFDRVDGCVSTGKEANVYHAVGPAPPESSLQQRHFAVKVYKTSILQFKDRDRYVTGEFRYRNGYSRSNPRKMVRVWAEKEMRNLKRIHKAGMRVPEPVEVRNNVLVMDFLGDGTWRASPRLKDADIPDAKAEELYIEALVLLRQLYHECRLIHADLSEYNILYHQSHLFVIDVSQSVEHDHPHAFDFLRSDIKNVDDFFFKRGVNTLGVIQTFAYVTQPSAHGVDGKESVAAILESIHSLRNSHQDERNHIDEAVFQQSYIPSQLKDVVDAERDIDILLTGGKDQLIYAGVTRLVGENRPEETVPVGEEAMTSDSEGDGEQESEQGDDDLEKTPKGKRFEDKDAKRERKQGVKQDRRERREKKKERKQTVKKKVK
ncbi:RIO1-domain-containing protein [Atractiella rhizophila]|nr:RIO1-domain-containing protein [Atractiella rhizophila]